MMKIAITTTTFGKLDTSPLQLLKDSSLEVVLNSYGRRLNQKELIKLTRNTIGLIAGTETLDSNILNQLPKVKVISRCGAGMDCVDLESAKKLGIKVFNTPDGPTLAVAEFTIGLILSLLRRISLMDREIRDNLWKKRMGTLLSGKQVGIIGFGRIGRKVAELLKAMDTEIYYTDPAVKEKEAGEFMRVGLKDLLKNSDIISLHLSYSKENFRLLGKKELSLMKQGSFLINCSRGRIVDEKALYSALKKGKLAGAAIDVFENEPYNGPLRELDNVILTPHIGSYAKEARVEMEMQAVRNLLEGLNK